MVMALIFSIITVSKNVCWLFFALTGYKCRRHNDVKKKKKKNIIILYILFNNNGIDSKAALSA